MTIVIENACLWLNCNFFLKKGTVLKLSLKCSFGTVWFILYSCILRHTASSLRSRIRSCVLGV